ncbi:MAG: ADP-ribosyltransferase domain-containing protein [Bacteriovoracaceae bacterium]
MKFLIILTMVISSSYSFATSCKFANTQFNSCLERNDKLNCYRTLVAMYSSDLYFDLNATLRGVKSDSDCLETADYLNTVLRSLPKKNAKIYRGTKLLPELKSLKVNSCISDKAFVSTSLRKWVAEQFTDKALMVIKAKSGRELGYLSAVWEEEEVLLPPNVWLKLKKKTIKSKYTQFEFEEVKSEDCLKKIILQPHAEFLSVPKEESED